MGLAVCRVVSHGPEHLLLRRGHFQHEAEAAGARSWRLLPGIGSFLFLTPSFARFTSSVKVTDLL